MKIGILTYHRVVNDGSVLQAYCGLGAVRTKFPGAKVEIIDYCPLTLLYTEYRKLFFSRKPPFIKVDTYKRINSIKKFISQYLNLSEESCFTNDLCKVQNYIKRQKYDIIFAGSDTVWEARQSKYVPEPPNIYYLPGIKESKKISYAASADPISTDFTSDRNKMLKIAKCLKKFDHITVRDSSTADYVRELCPKKEISFMPDPTLQYDFSSLIKKPSLEKQRPWAGINFIGELKAPLVKQLQQNGFDIVDFSDMSINAQPIPGGLSSVNLRLGLFSMLDFLVTDRFHSSIFTFKLSGAPVLFIEHSSKWPRSNSKGRDLFNRLNISSMVYRYESKNIEADFLSKKIQTGEQLFTDLNDKLNEISNLAQEQFNKIFPNKKELRI